MSFNPSAFGAERKQGSASQHPSPLPLEPAAAVVGPTRIPWPVLRGQAESLRRPAPVAPAGPRRKAGRSGQSRARSAAAPVSAGRSFLCCHHLPAFPNFTRASLCGSPQTVCSSAVPDAGPSRAPLDAPRRPGVARILSTTAAGYGVSQPAAGRKTQAKPCLQSAWAVVFLFTLDCHGRLE